MILQRWRQCQRRFCFVLDVMHLQYFQNQRHLCFRSVRHLLSKLTSAMLPKRTSSTFGVHVTYFQGRRHLLLESTSLFFEYTSPTFEVDVGDDGGHLCLFRVMPHGSHDVAEVTCRDRVVAVVIKQREELFTLCVCAIKTSTRVKFVRTNMYMYMYQSKYTCTSLLAA